jgi:hypothetical protein
MLTPTESTILALERKWWQYAGSKDQAIRDELDMSSTRYHQTLNRLIDTERALAADPVTTNRLRRLRAARKRSR